MTLGHLGRGLAALSVASVAVVGLQAPALAQQGGGRPPGSNCPNPAGNYPPGQCRAGVSDNTVTPGQRVTFTSGSDACPPNSSVTVRVISTTDTTQSDSFGNSTYDFTVPQGTRPGRQELSFSCVLSSNVVRVPFTVVAAAAARSDSTRAGALPRTGADHVTELAAAGIGMVLIGAGTTLVARRRRNSLPGGLA